MVECLLIHPISYSWFSRLERSHDVVYEEKFQWKLHRTKATMAGRDSETKGFVLISLKYCPTPAGLSPGQSLESSPTAKADLLLLLLPGCERNRHLNLRRVWKATQQRSPWAVPGGTEHAQALTNWSLAATSVHRPAPQCYCWKYNTQLHTSNLANISTISVLAATAIAISMSHPPLIKPQFLMHEILKRYFNTIQNIALSQNLQSINLVKNVHKLLQNFGLKCICGDFCDKNAEFQVLGNHWFAFDPLCSQCQLISKF